MPGMTRKGDLLKGHGCFPVHNIDTHSSTVYINGILASKFGSVSTVHCCGSCHTGTMIGDNTVLIEGVSAQKIGDGVSCGSVQAEGSPDVLIG